MSLDYTLLFQIVNTAILLLILIGIPFLIIYAIGKRKHLEKRVNHLELEIDELKKKPL